MLTRTIYAIMLGILVWCCCSCQERANEQRSTTFSYYDMRDFGHCLPFDLANVSIAAEVHLSDSPILTVAFIADHKILAVTGLGEVYLYDVLDDDWSRLLESRVEAPWVLRPVTETTFLLWVIRDPGGYFYYDLEGQLHWTLQYDVFGGPPIVDSESIIIPTLSSAGETGITVYDLYGNLKQSIDSQIGLLPSFINSGTGIIVLDTQGPHLLSRSEMGYSLELWNGTWNSGIGRTVTLDSAGRLISLEQARTEISILERTTEQPEIVSIWNSGGYPFPDISLIASNGETLAVLQETKVLRYVNGKLNIWASDLSGLLTGGMVYDFCIDSACKRFLILDGHGLVQGGDDGSSRLEFDGTVIGDLKFSRDFQRAAVGTQQGDVIILSIEAKSDQNE